MRVVLRLVTQFYLTHDVYKNWNPYGVPYLDATCSEGLDSPHVLIYGHHMNDGTVFSDFARFSDRGFAHRHNLIYLQTPHSQEVYEVCAVDVHEADNSFIRTDFISSQDFALWGKQALSQSDLSFTTPNAYPKHLVSFVTCSYNSSNNERTVVMAARKGELEVCYE